MSNPQEISTRWQQNDWKDMFKHVLGKQVELIDGQIKCLKSSRKRTSVWKLMITNHIQSLPVVLKIYKTPLKQNHEVEINMYEKANQLFQKFMPKLYGIERNDDEIWMFFEYVQPLRGQIKLVPKHLEKIIPTVAKFHAHTFESHYLPYKDTFDAWVPPYHSKEKNREKTKHIEKTKKYLDEGMKDRTIRKMLEPHYDVLQRILQKGPIFFPEVVEAGQSLIHGDLHIHNISCHNASEDSDWKIRFVDWESVKYAPVWFDLVVLVEILLDFRGDWQKNAEEIRKKCVHAYSEEMKKYGITFSTDPLILLKMTYLQRTLEKKLSNHIRRVLRGEKSLLLTKYLQKIKDWGKELDLY
ncbi:MAG TPA: aminoglycoside phosphotransferase family protein [Bacillota bacterium]